MGVDVTWKIQKWGSSVIGTDALSTIATLDFAKCFQDGYCGAAGWREMDNKVTVIVLFRESVHNVVVLVVEVDLEG